jgi:hypothetical protein
LRHSDGLDGNPLSCGLVPATDEPGRCAGSYGVGGDGAGYDRVGSDDGAVADVGSGEYGDTVADPHVATDGDGSIVRKVTLYRALARVTLIGTGVETVGMVGDDDAAAAEEALGNGDLVGAGYMDVVREIAVGADVECRVVGSASEVSNGIKPETVAGREVLSQTNVVEAGKFGVLAEAEATGAEPMG